MICIILLFRLFLQLNQIAVFRLDGQPRLNRLETLLVVAFELRQLKQGKRLPIEGLRVTRVKLCRRVRILQCLAKFFHAQEGLCAYIEDSI